MNARKIVKKLIPRSLFRYIEPYGHLAEAILFNVLNGWPGRGLKVIGVTGTNGKTSTVYLIQRMLSESGIRTGLMSTVGYGVDKDIKPQIQHMTNVAVPELMSRLKWFRNQRVDWLVLETTSHALAQNRVFGIPYSVAVMTNITHEHLDYHRTFANYLAAKVKLFKKVSHNKKGLGLGIINADDPNAQAFIAATKQPVLYGVNGGEIKAEDIVLKPTGVSYKVRYQGRELNIKCRLPGSFNVYNSLAAVSVGLKLGLSNEQIEKGITSLKGVEGRMTTIDEGQNFTVIVDFAHTPDSFEKLFKDLKPVVKGKLIVMFGSAGRRDEAKRAVQGELAGKYADEVIITEEDDRDIDGLEIINQIAEGAIRAGKIKDQDLFFVHDRPSAIEFSLRRAVQGDTVLLLGKGHEKTIERADGEHPWNEIETAKKAVRQITAKKTSVQP